MLCNLSKTCLVFCSNKFSIGLYSSCHVVFCHAKDKKISRHSQQSNSSLFRSFHFLSVNITSHLLHLACIFSQRFNADLFWSALKSIFMMFRFWQNSFSGFMAIFHIETAAGRKIVLIVLFQLLLLLRFV